MGRVKNGTSPFSSGIDASSLIAMTTQFLELPYTIRALIQMWAVNLILPSRKGSQVVGDATWESALRQPIPGWQGVWENLGSVLVRLGWS